MKKLLLSSTIALLVGIVMVSIAAVLNSIYIDPANFAKADLVSTLLAIGYLVTIVAGVIFTATSIAEAIKSGETAKLKLVSLIATAVAGAVIVGAGVLRAVALNINSTNFNLFGSSGAVLANSATNGIVPVLAQLGYLVGVIAAVILIASTVAGLAKGGDTKKVILLASITTAIGVASVLVSAVLVSLQSNITSTTFVLSAITSVLTTLGYLVAALAGVLLVGTTVANLTKGADAKRLVVVTSILTAVGLSLVLIASVLYSLNNSISTANFQVLSLTETFRTIGYLVAILSGILLIAAGVASAAKGEK